MSDAMHGHVTALIRQGDGDQLAADAISGATTLTVLDVADFSEGGGQLRLNDEIYDYLSIDDDTSTITLVAPGLTDPAAADDLVDVWDPEAEATVLEFVATVVDDTTEDVIQAVVAHDLADRMADNIRGLVGESVVCEEDGDGIWVLTRVLGRSPEIDGEYVMVPGPDGTVRLPTTLQGIYDAADATAEAANEAAALAQQAYDSASGKNTIWRDIAPPGATPNVVGDTWFQFSVPDDPSDPDAAFKQNIVAQYIGLGGTAWRQVEIAGEVIAYLDAGKLTAGSAFINALQVLTLLTLGNATTNGVIQSYDFANQPVGVLIDKNGLVAKGGIIAGALVVGGIVEGALFRTGTTGRRIEITTDGGITMHGTDAPQSAGPGYIDPGADLIGAGFFAGVLRISPPLGSSHPSGTPRPTLYLVSQPASLGGAFVSVDVEFRPTQGVSTGAGIQGSSLYASGETHAGPGNVAAYITPGGQLVKTASTRRVKRDIRPMTSKVARTVLRMQAVTHALRGVPGKYKLPGFIAEQAAEAGAELWITRDADGIPDTVRYPEVTVAHNVILGEHDDELAALRKDNTELRRLVTRLERRLTKIEGAHHG